MKILGIESSSLVASTAIWEDDVIVAEYTVNFKKTHSQTLLPMIDEIVTMTETDLAAMDAIAVSAGPGSFTGLRIGSATGKGLGLALKKPLIHVPTIEAMAYQCYSSRYMICPIMDARRNQVYTGLYTFSEETGEMKTILEPTAIDVKDLAAELSRYGIRPTLFVGDGIPVYRKQLEELLVGPCYFAPAFMNRQRAAAVASLGAVYLKEGKTESAADHRPEYLRKSQAEREREARERNQGHESR